MRLKISEEMQNKPETCQPALDVTRAEIELKKLNLLMKQLKRNRFGYTLEQTDPSLFQLGLEDLKGCIAAAETDQMIMGESDGRQYSRIREPSSKSELIPTRPHQPDSVIISKDKNLPNCSDSPYVSSKAASELLMDRRCRCDHRRLEEGMTQESMLKNDISSMAPERFLAYALIRKYIENLPLYRQVQVLRVKNIKSALSELSYLTGRACYFLRPLYQELLENVLGSPKIFVDCVEVSTLDPQRGRTGPGKIWVYAVDDRPWDGAKAPAVVYIYSEDYKLEPPCLINFNGILQVDRRSYLGRLFDKRDPEHVRLALCWAYCRHQFDEIYKATNLRIAADALERITQLYVIEEQINNHSEEIRKSIRQTQCRPILSSLQIWLHDQFSQLPSGSPLAKVISHILSEWEAFTMFVDDGRVEIDNNTTERLIRPVVLSRRNQCLAGFSGGAQHWTIVASLIQSAKLNGVDPLDYLCDVLKHITICYGDVERLNLLLPWTWKAHADS